MPRLSWLLTALLLLSAPVARAQSSTDLLGGFGTFALEAPVTSGVYTKTTYSDTGPAQPGSAGKWNIAQFDIPGSKLSAFKPKQAGGVTEYDAEAAAAAVRVIEAPTGPIVILTQKGDTLPCTHPDGRPREWDLFIATPVIAAGLKHTPLTGLIALRQTVNISSVGGPSQISKSCAVNKGGAIISVIMSDDTVQPRQIFFYQLAVSTVCRQEGNGQPCNTNHTDFTYYSNKEPYGADDYLPLLGRAMISGTDLSTLNVNLLPRLIRVIQKGPPSLDKNLSHWVVNSVYAGQHIWGDLTLTTGWQNYRLIAETH